MIDIDTYHKLEEKYGYTSSWTIWKEPGNESKSNTDDMSIFNDDNICNSLNNNYVFVGLNASNTHGIQEERPWKNFHSSYSYQNDYKLRYALMNTKFWGSYITDIIKEYPEVDSKKVKAYLKSNPEIITKNIEIFKKELNILSKQKPTLIAIGNDSYDILIKNLKDYQIILIPHYAKWIGPEKYRNEVLNKLNKK